MLMDGRIYVFGGETALNTPCPQLAWVYDLDKSTWFALEMEYPLDCDFSVCQKVPISISKVLLMSGSSKWVFEIYQSKLTQVEGELEGSGTFVGVKGELVRCWSEGWEITKKEIICEKVNSKRQ
jgi:hypothetical protein